MTSSSSENSPPRLSDEQLLQSHKQGDQTAFEQLIQRYRAQLFHFLVRFTANRATAEDVFQEAFLQVHLSVDSFDPKRRFKPWLFTIAANKARDHMRKQARRPAAPLSAPVGGDSEEESQSFVDLLQADLPLPEERMAEKETAERITQTIYRMPEHLREILLLAYFEQFSYNDIAQILSIPLGTVKSRLHTAVGTFARQWKSENQQAEST